MIDRISVPQITIYPIVIKTWQITS